VRVVAGVDVDPSVRATYEANHRSVARFVETDIRRLSADDVRGWLPPGATADDLVLVGCSPCQFWSRLPTDRTASKQGSRLVLAFAKLVREVRPRFVVIENVAGLATRGRRTVLGPFLKHLGAWGYSVAHGVIDSTWYGVPQVRPRFLLVASRGDPDPGLPARRKMAPPCVRQFIGQQHGFRALAAGGIDPGDPWHRASGLSRENLARIRLTPCDGGDRRAWRDTPLQIATYRGRDHCFRNVYGRMWWDRPAATLTTRFNSLSNGRFGHPDEDRAISVREGACLQTFPRSYRFAGTMSEVCRQVGNAVPPVLAQAVGRHLLDLHDLSRAPGGRS
jgi:DNA (cytosine-5)-methyltransferase 1